LTLQTALRQGSEILEKSGVPAPRLTAEVLLSHALHCERAYLYAHGGDELTTLGWIHYGPYLDERLRGKPTQYITKKQEFYGREFRVTPDVLIPRPETEHLVEAAIADIRARRSSRILDVGTGSGAIAISLALETSRPVFANDVSEKALAVARANRDRHNAAVSFFSGDLASAVAARSIDLLVSNPPYVPSTDAANMQREVRDWEPHTALFAGESGLEIYERLVAEAAVVVRPSGHLMMELGYQSLSAVRAMLQRDWVNTETVCDLAGLPRVVTAVRRT
jgi:release factor glutamine methyltransferase